MIRHTRVNLEPGICYGRSDIELADTFAQESMRLLNKLDNKKSKVYTSPLKRCLQLAGLFSKDPLIDDRLLELDFGEWEMKRWDDIESNVLQTWMADFVEYSCPGGESFQKLYYRSVSFYRDLVRQNFNSAIIVTHAGVIRSLLAYIMNIPLQKAFDIPVGYGSISKIDHKDENFRVVYFNK